MKAISVNNTPKQAQLLCHRIEGQFLIFNGQPFENRYSYRKTYKMGRLYGQQL
jgi:hypothetical protein